MRALFRKIWGNESALLILLGMLLGIATGLGAVFCRWGIDAIRNLAFGTTGDITVLAGQAVDSGQALLVLLLPAVGGLFVAPLIHYGAREAKGHGVPEVMNAIALHAGRIRPRVAIIKAISSVITIGTGGSVGWEGPIIQIGAGIGSSVGQLLRVARRHMRVLVACGAAAGIGATFNAPIAGVLFALEIFIGELAVVTFTPVVVAAVAGTAVSILHFGPHGVLELPEHIYHLHSVWEIPLYALLGITCAVGAVLFTRSVYLAEDLFDAARIPALLKPALGGLALGAIGIAMPSVLGVGYVTIDRALHGDFALNLLVGIFFVKLVATCLTLGSGGSGGIFGPSLVLGSMVGAAFGAVAQGALPGEVANPGVYAVVGMAALVAGTTHAPISAILIIFEMTKDYEIILPLMIACVISSTAARGMLAESIYTLKLARRGIRLRGGRDAAVLRSLLVGDTMRRDPTLFYEHASFEDVRRRALESPHHVYPVVDAEERMLGVIVLDTLRPFLFEEGLQHVAIAGDLAAEVAETIGPEEDLERARELFARTPREEIPVVEPSTGRVVGILREHDLYAAYNRAADQIQ